MTTRENNDHQFPANRGASGEGPTDAFQQVEGVEDGKAVYTSLVVHPVRIVVPLTKPKSWHFTAKASGQ